MAATVEYNVYRVAFHQISGIDHEGIALVPAQRDDQTAGRYYHVTGNVGLGMDYERKPAFKFGQRPDFKSQEYMYTIKKTSLTDWEAITADVPPPYDERVLTERRPDPPAEDCTTWVKEALRRGRDLAVIESLGEPRSPEVATHS